MQDTAEARTPLATSWVQGMRPPEQGKQHELSWQELLFRRVTGRLGGIPSRETTLKAETALGFPHRMAYYYVGRCIPEFGSNAVATEPVPSAFTTPFDTGALAKGKIIATTPKVKKADIGRFVSDHSYEGASYQEPFVDWMSKAYNDPSHYLHGAHPLEHCVSAITLEKCAGDARVWTWEARVQSIDHIDDSIQIRQVFLAKGTREPYADWVENTPLMTSEERTHHLDNFYRYSEEVGDAATAMLNYLKKELMM